MRFVSIKGRLYGVRTSNWQADYRLDGYLPFSVRYGHRKPAWRVVHLGRFGCLTLGRMETIALNPTRGGAMTTRKATP